MRRTFKVRRTWRLVCGYSELGNERMGCVWGYVWGMLFVSLSKQIAVGSRAFKPEILFLNCANKNPIRLNVTVA